MKTIDIIKEIGKEIIANKDKLTKLDQLIGDADHGENMALGFNQILAQIDTIEPSSQKIIEFVGQTLMSIVGGASGPLYGMAFIAGSQVLSDADTMVFSDFKKFVASGLQSIATLGNAEVGHKTMVDVWEPLKNKLDQMVILSKEDIINFINESRDKTKDMQAKKGRASYLGERSIGTIDPGSFSSAIILVKMVQGIDE